MMTLLFHFAALMAVIMVAGSYLARFADQLGERMGLSRSMAGILLLAVATSLPELAVSCHAVMIPAVDLAVGDMFGSCLFNLLILAVLDLTTRTRGSMLSRSAAAHAISAMSSILLTSVALLFLLVDQPWSIGRMGLGSITILFVYLLCLRLIYFDQRFERADEPPAESDPRPLWRIVTGYVLATAAILLTAPQLAELAHQLSIVTGLGGTFVGTTLVALATSLPEISTTWAAIRMGALEMAIGNILGSNSFNIVVLFAVDLCYAEPLLAAASQTHAITAASVIVITALVTLGMLYRAEKRFWIIEPDAVLVMLAVFGALALVYWSG